MGSGFIPLFNKKHWLTYSNSFRCG